jgi:hypothetical protein
VQKVRGVQKVRFRGFCRFKWFEELKAGAPAK